jgi:hypothetical protein
MAKKVRYDDYPERDNSRKSSYTDFSSRFPGEGGKAQLTRELRERRQRSTLRALAIVGCAGVVLVGFFVTLILLSVSRQQPGNPESTDVSSMAQTPEEQTAQPPEEMPAFGKIRALTAPEAALGGNLALDRFIKSAKDSSCDTAVFWLKNAQGRLLYYSELEQAAMGDIMERPYSAAAASIAKVKDAGLRVIVRISCFRDSTAPSELSEAAVRYSKNTKVLWLDDYPDRGGKPWLNPFSREACDYLLGVIREAAALDPDAIELTGVQFPDGAQSLAFFPGEDKATAPTRNAQLLQFVKDAKSAAGKLPLLCEMDAKAALQKAGAAVYGGNLWSAEADALIIPVKSTAEAGLVRAAAPEGVHWVPELKNAPKEGDYEEFIVS